MEQFSFRGFECQSGERAGRGKAKTEIGQVERMHAPASRVILSPKTPLLGICNMYQRWDSLKFISLQYNNGFVYAIILLQAGYKVK